MIIPRYWAESCLRHKKVGQRMTVRRFGWSDAGQAEAQAMADERASEAMRQLLRGAKVPRREAKQVYGGAEGLPIREEIVRTEGDTVITRNGYGALCLNTPDVMFVDVDVDEGPRFRLSCGLGAAILAVSVAAAIWQRHYGIFILCGTVLLVVTLGVLKLMNAVYRRAGQSPWDAALERIRRFARAPGLAVAPLPHARGVSRAGDARAF